MKKLFTIFALVLSSFTVYAQNTSTFEKIKLETKEDYTPEAENAALSAANTILSSEVDKVETLNSFKYLMRWMTGVPGYNFLLDETPTKISKDNEKLLIIYLAAMAKYSLENKAQKDNDKLVKLNTVKLVLGYCNTFDVKMTGELKKLNQANEKGELEKRLKI